VSPNGTRTRTSRQGVDLKTGWRHFVHLMWVPVRQPNRRPIGVARSISCVILPVWGSQAFAMVSRSSCRRVRRGEGGEGGGE
jgi:hypothetical protein